MVALRHGRHPQDSGRTPHERRARHRHHLPDARAGLRGQERPAAAQGDHLVRLARRGDRRRSAGTHRPRLLPGAHAQLAGQLHGIEAGMGQTQRTGAFRPHRPLHAAGRLPGLPSLGRNIDHRQRTLGADSVGLQGGAPRRLRGRLLRHSPPNDSRRRRLDRHRRPHECGHRDAPGHPGRHPDQHTGAGDQPNTPSRST